MKKRNKIYFVVNIILLIFFLIMVGIFIQHAIYFTIVNNEFYKMSSYIIVLLIWIQIQIISHKLSHLYDEEKK
jgi:hypothetical protein